MTATLIPESRIQNECHYYLILANDLGYGDSTRLIEQLDEVSKLLQAYTKAILDSIS